MTAGRVLIFTYASAGCAGDVVEFEVSSENVDQGMWTDTTGSINISATETSVQFRLGVSKGSGLTEPGSVHLDNVYIHSAAVFNDRFESPE